MKRRRMEFGTVLQKPIKSLKWISFVVPNTDM
jgi:hypothetical protein